MNMEMHKHIAAPVHEVFARATDLANLANTVDAITRVEVLTEGPVRVGTRFSETRVMFGKEHSETMEVSQFDLNRRISFVADSWGCRYDSGFAFESSDDGTLVTFDFKATPRTFMARLMKPVGLLMAKSMRKMVEQDLEDLRRACESANAST